jgi:hypothetical protein
MRGTDGGVAVNVHSIGLAALAFIGLGRRSVRGHFPEGCPFLARDDGRGRGIGGLPGGRGGDVVRGWGGWLWGLDIDHVEQTEVDDDVPGDGPACDGVSTGLDGEREVVFATEEDDPVLVLVMHVPKVKHA